MAKGPRVPFTIDEIVQEADVAKGSFYNHFPDKDALAYEVRRAIREMEERQVGIINLNIDDPVARIARGIAVYAKMAVHSPENARILTANRAGEGYRRSNVDDGLFIDILAGLQQARISAPSAEAASMLVIGQVAILLARLADEADPIISQSMAYRSISLTLVGLGVGQLEARHIAGQAISEICFRGNACKLMTKLVK